MIVVFLDYIHLLFDLISICRILCHRPHAWIQEIRSGGGGGGEGLGWWAPDFKKHTQKNINLFHRWLYGPPSRSNWSRGIQLLLEGGVCVSGGGGGGWVGGSYQNF